jgi:outer membrane receptor protein involved in Fe transport
MSIYRDWGLDLSGEQRLNDLIKLRGKLFYHNHVDVLDAYSDLNYNNMISGSRWQDYVVGGALFADLDLHPKDVLRFALHYAQDLHSRRDDDYLPYADSVADTGSVAVENEWKPHQNMVVVAGFSYDWFTVGKAEKLITDDNGDYVETQSQDTPGSMDGFNPMIGVTYSFEDHTKLIASVARKTRFPTLMQLYHNSRGNPKLKDQSSINYTLGVSRPLGGIAFAEASVFYHDITDRISSSGPYDDSLYHNYGSIKLYGFEVGGELKPLDGLALRLYYTHLRSMDDSDDAVTDDVVDAPEHKIDASLNYTLPKLETGLFLQGLYMGSMYDQVPTAASPDNETLEVPGYFLLNARISQPLWDNFEVYAWAGNLFDRDYQGTSNYPAPGRNFWIGIKARF